MARKKDGRPRAFPADQVPMTMSGFCQHGPGSSHIFCHNPTCTCLCHTTPKPEEAP